MGLMLLSKMKICVPDSVTRIFNDRVRASFPRETLGYLIGCVDENMTARVNEIYFPKDLDQHCGTRLVDVQYRWFREARAYARKAKAVILGDIHSHPYTVQELVAYKSLTGHGRTDCSPSEADLERVTPGFISGICLAKEDKNGRVRLRTRYWGPVQPVSEVIDNA